jgi:hypothetical protein
MNAELPMSLHVGKLAAGSGGPARAYPWAYG